MDATLDMLRELTEAPGIPGSEEAVRRIMRRYLEPLGEILTDNLGSIAARKVGDASGPKIILGGHLDEIGFMVIRITDEGFLKFQTLGGWLEQVMLAQRVEVYTHNGPIIGVIGAKPPHIVPADQRKKMVDKKDMFIDIGAASRAEAESWGVRPGDPVVPVCPFTLMRNEKLLMAKAWDNRLGCALVIAVMQQLQSEAHPNIVYAVGTVQEEVGLRGATTMANIIEPDIGIILETAIAGDMPGVKPDEAQSKMGHGPALLLYDSTMVPHTGMRNLVVDTAHAENIPLQFDLMAGGGTDAGKFHITGAGAPSIVIGSPVRYIHSHAGILHRDDFDQTVRLLVAMIKRLDAETVMQLKS